jgi:hypothetical protein
MPGRTVDYDCGFAGGTMTGSDLLSGRVSGWSIAGLGCAFGCPVTEAGWFFSSELTGVTKALFSKDICILPIVLMAAEFPTPNLNGMK